MRERFDEELKAKIDEIEQIIRTYSPQLSCRR